MHKKFEINWTKIKDGCQSGRKVVTHNSKSDLPLVNTIKSIHTTVGYPTMTAHLQYFFLSTATFLTASETKGSNGYFFSPQQRKMK